ncbi:type IV secretory system conjugative DNA transfer family protein [Pseudomonas sp. JG-B]|uniref:type IV secretory system conjugative DNA transfer family protein n=1 Tax=Pseudomonas sp. JG-B TaxID=2603214 RepID=UPI0015B481D4|nr:type IV secretory system conjugative DNA transfer family protein [Pseudomonas sp. JG-B]
MTLNISNNKWLKVGLVLSWIITALLSWAYIAGQIFFAVAGLQGNPSLTTIYDYWHHYRNLEQIRGHLVVASGLSFGIVGFFTLLLFKPKRRALHGEARFAKPKEVKKAGLLGDNGIIVVTTRGNISCMPALLTSCCRRRREAVRGVGIVIPNLFNWSQSLVVLDIKQENWDITSGYRKKYGQKCYLFNPTATDFRTHRYNPLSYISEDPNFRIDDIQKIANMLFPDQPGTDVIWTATPRTLFMGIVLLLLETPGKTVTMGQVLRETLADGDGSKYFNQVITDRGNTSNPLSGQCVRALRAYTSIASDNTRAGVMTSFRSRLELWNNPLVDAATSENDFDLREIRRQKMSIYLGVTPDNLESPAAALESVFPAVDRT